MKATLKKKPIGTTHTNQPVDPYGKSSPVIAGEDGSIEINFKWGEKQETLVLAPYFLPDSTEYVLRLYEKELGPVNGALLEIGTKSQGVQRGFSIFGNFFQVYKSPDAPDSFFAVLNDENAIYYNYGDNYQYGLYCANGVVQFTTEEGKPLDCTFNNGLKIDVNPRQPAITYEGTISEEAGGSAGIGSYTLKYTPTYDEGGNLVGGCGTLALSFTTAPSSGATLYLSNPNTLPDLTGVVFGAGTPVMVAIEGAPSNGSVLHASAAFGASSYEGGINVFSN